MVNMTNKTIPATKAKTAFAQLVDSARNEPVTVTRNSRAIAVVMSPEKFEQLSALEDAYWASEAKKAQKSGFLSNKESTQLLNEMLNA